MPRFRGSVLYSNVLYYKINKNVNVARMVDQQEPGHDRSFCLHVPVANFSCRLHIYQRQILAGFRLSITMQVSVTVVHEALVSLSAGEILRNKRTQGVIRLQVSSYLFKQAPAYHAHPYYPV